MFVRIFDLETGEDIYTDGQGIYIHKDNIYVEPDEEEAELICEMWELLYGGGKR